MGEFKQILRAALVVAMIAPAAIVATESPAIAGTTIVVNTTSDIEANDGECSLREAIASANDDAASGAAAGECPAGSGNDTIEFATPSTTIVLNSLLIITDGVEIKGAGTVLDQAAAINILSVDATGATVRLRNMTLTQSGGEGSVVVAGGTGEFFNVAIVNNAKTGVWVWSGSTAIFDGGLISGNATSSSAYSAVHNHGTLTLRNGVLVTNNGGLGVETLAGGVTTIEDSTISNNGSPSNPNGGGINNESITTITRSTVSNNTAITGAGMYNKGDLTVIDSEITGNNTNGGGGTALYQKGTATLIATTISGNTGGTTVFHFTSSSATTPIETTFINSLITANSTGSSNVVTARSTNPGIGSLLVFESSTVAGNDNSNEVIFADDAGVAVRNSIVWGNTNDALIASDPSFLFASFSVVDDVSLGLANLAVDPLFADPANDDFRLQLISPALNNGNVGSLPTDIFDIDDDGDLSESTPDLGLNNRIEGPNIDRGAYERQIEPFVILPIPCFLTTGSLTPNTPLTINVAGLCGVPTDDVSSVMLSLTAIDPSGGGNLRISEAGVAPNGGVVNYAANGLDNTNTVTVPLSAAGQIDLEANVAATDYRINILGYYHPDGTLRYTPIAPCAVSDSRPSQSPTGSYVGPFDNTNNHPDVQITGTFPGGQGGELTCGIPIGADGVMVNLVALSATGGPGGGLAAGPGSTQPPMDTTNYADIGLNNAAATVVPLDSPYMALEVNGDGATTVHTRVVALGYFTEDEGAGYTPVNPCAAFDSRFGALTFAGKRTAGTSGVNTTGATTYRVINSIPADQGGETDCNVPGNVTAVLINLVAIQPDAPGNFRAYATGSTPTGGVLNFAPLSPTMNNSNAIVVPINTSGDLTVFVNAPSNDGNATVHVRGVILGYYS